MITITCTELRLIFSKAFRCGSNKCLNSKAGAAALIGTFYIGMSDSMACRGKIAPYSGETFFSILLDNSFIELPESNLKFGKSKNLFNFYEHT